jgi:NAD(P)-dependent dehydrogenase (short-subunit alcohol dehydrogenase family)
VFGTVRRAKDAAVVEADGGTPVTLDVTHAPGIPRARDAVERELGGRPFVGLVNNAGISAVGALELYEVEALRRVLEVNVVGAVALTQAFLPLLRASRGRIINISSVAARLALPFAGPYAASKWALEALSDSLRRELRHTGVHVTVIQPGSVRTAIWEKISAVDLAPYKGTIYEPAVARLRELALRSGERGIAPARVAQAVLRALTARRPPTRMLVVGRGTLWQILAPLLPDRLADWLVERRINRRQTGRAKREP